MNLYDFVNMFHSMNLERFKIGNIFIHEMHDLQYDDQALLFFKYWKDVCDFNIESNWFLPFDTITYLRTTKDTNNVLLPYGVEGVTINSPFKRRIVDPFEFKFVHKLGVFSGSSQIVYIKDKSEEEIENIRKSYDNGDGLVVFEDLKRFNYYKEDIIFITRIRSVRSKKSKSKNSTAVKRFTQKTLDDSVMRDLMMYIQRTVFFCLGYFTEKIINNRLAIIEETVAKRVNGVTVKAPGKEPLYRIMPIKDIRKRYIHTNHGDRTLKLGHERCQHERLLRSDRFPNKKGQRIVVRACRVGPAEAFDPNKSRLYKVLFDSRPKMDDQETRDDA